MTENEIDLYTLDLLQGQGYEYINGTEIALMGLLQKGCHLKRWS